MQQSYDVIVIGLGAMGSAAARDLARRGSSVLGLEQFTPVHTLGSSHGDTRIVRKAYFEHPDYVPLLRRAYTLWDELGAELGRPLFTRTGALMIGAPESPVVAGTLASAQKWDLAHDVLDAAAMRQRYPQFALRSTEIAIYEADAGYVSPEDTVRAPSGPRARRGCRTALQHAGDRVAVRRRRCARRIRRRPGPGGQVGADGRCLDRRAGARPDGAAARRTPRDALFNTARRPAAFDAAQCPVYVFQTGPGDEIYGFPLVGASSNGVKVGFHHRGGNADPTTLNRDVSPAERAEMRELLAERIPGLAGEHVDARVCMYTLTPDEHFVIDQLSGSSGRVSVAAGFSGHGFKFTPVVGEILADLATTGSTKLPIGFRRAARFGAV